MLEEDFIKHYLTIDLEDWYHGHYPGYDFHSHSFFAERVTDPTFKILDLLDESGHKATFFTLGIISERYPSLIKEIFNRGHELACHGWDHDLLDSMSDRNLIDWMKKNKSIIESLTGQRVLGFRAPNFSVTNSNFPHFLNALKECGFTYDSSIYSGKLCYGGINDPSILHEAIQNLQISFYPISSGSFCGFKFPFGGFYFRLMPLVVFQKKLIKFERENKSAVFYIHPKDIDIDNPNLPSYFYNNVIHKLKTKSAHSKLSQLLSCNSWQPIRSNEELCNKNHEKTE
jgi:polysaccharide deacetylase family protein (PEP-CTERM system associated)